MFRPTYFKMLSWSALVFSYTFLLIRSCLNYYNFTLPLTYIIDLLFALTYTFCFPIQPLSFLSSDFFPSKMPPVDPTNEEQPDFTEERYTEDRLATGLPPEDAATAAGILARVWNLAHQRRVVEWEEYLHQQEELRRQQRRSPSPPPPPPPRPVPVLPIVNRQLSIPSDSHMRCSDYAFTQLKNFDYVELWYFLPTACEQARAELSISQSAYGLVQSGSSFEIRTVNSQRASKQAIPDFSLSFANIVAAYPTFSREIERAGWSQDLLLSWHDFYWRLTTHVHAGIELYQGALVLFHAKTRRCWFEDMRHALDAIKAGAHPDANPMWDIGGPLPEDAIRECYREHVQALELQGLHRMEDSIARLNSMVNQRRVRSPSPFQSRKNPRRDISPRQDTQPASRDTRQSNPGDRSSRQRLPGRDNPKSTSTTSRQVFDKGAVANQEICGICLSRQPHRVSECNLPNLWNGDPARCRRFPNKGITNPRGQRICVEWQRPHGCRDLSSKHIHECSGCGDSGHGAHKCPLAEAS